MVVAVAMIEDADTKALLVDVPANTVGDAVQDAETSTPFASEAMFGRSEPFTVTG